MKAASLPANVLKLPVLAAGYVFLASGSSPARADPVLLPSGGIVTAGSASIVATGPANTLIVQRGRNAVINWQSFSIGAGASVTFQQPDSAAIALNRVVGPGASTVNGNLFANGQVWLVNGNGVLFGQGSRIDVGGLLATTSDIRDADFLSGRYAFGIASGSPDAAVINQGSIKAATGGSAVLSGARVANEGVIQASLGRVVLGGASKFSVAFDGDNLLRYQIDAPVTVPPKDESGKPAAALVSNSGAIVADGGKVLMTARAARNVVDNVINSTGIIQARSASIRNGEVILDAGEDGAASVAGRVDVSGPSAGESGGTITVLGGKVAIADGARLDASGDAGGGTILIGGNLYGAGPEPNAQTASVGRSDISADATGSGKGGTVAIFSTGKTSVAASLSAKGVASGGMVETSGDDLHVEAGARVDTSASAGAAGLWLLDPQNVDIDSVFAANITTSIATTNVSVTASNDVNVNAPVVYTSANSLTFLAGRNLTINANVQNGGAGEIFAVAGWDGVTDPSAVLSTTASYGGNGGSVLIGGNNANRGVAIGSRNGTTTVAALDLTLMAENSYAQLGYHSGGGNPVASGNIAVLLNGKLNLTGNDNVIESFAQIGHGGNETSANQSGDIAVAVRGPVYLSGGTGVGAYAQIGNGGLARNGNSSGDVLVTSGGDVTMVGQASLSAAGTGDALVLATVGDFKNQAVGAALNVSGGGRWLVFLNAPANNAPGGLSAFPFYNRTFDFSTSSYATVTSAGNRFVYALAPMVTVTATDQTKVYGSANPSLSATITGSLVGDSPAGVVAGTPSLGTVATARSGVGDYAIIGGLGTLTSDFNYGFQFVNGNLHIDPATVTASLTGTVQKVYDGNTAATLSATNYQLTGVLSGDSVALTGPASGVYNSKGVGTSKVVSVTGLTLLGPDVSNYVLTASNLSGAIGVIDPAVVTASLTGTVHKLYDGTAAATLSAANYQLAGILPSDNVTLNSAGSFYDSKDVGTSKTVSVTGLTLLGSDGANYMLTTPNLSGAIGVIDPATVAVSLTGTVQKVYDGTTAATLSAANYQLTGILSGDSVTLTNPTTGAYSNKDVGTSKVVSVTGLTLLGPDVSNYVLTASNLSVVIGVIDPAAVTASLTGTVQKIYDGTTAAALNLSNYNLTGVIPGDSVALNNPAVGVYENRTVAAGKTVTVGGLALVGADAGNYVLTSSQVSGLVGIIAINHVVDLLGNSFTSNGVLKSSLVSLGLTLPAGGGATGPSDATSDTAALDDEYTQSDATAFKVGKSLSGTPGSAQSSTSVLIDGLLRQFSPLPGAALPHGVPPYGQIYSSWGNEAFWQ